MTLQNYMNIPTENEEIHITELPVRPVGRIIKNAGANRVAEAAKETLTAYLDQYGMEVSTRALRIARENGRKTVTKDDILAAVRDL